MRTISLEMVGWDIHVPADSDFAGRNRENNATKIVIHTAVEEGCVYSIDISAGMTTKVADIMVAEEGAVTYILPSAVTKANTISFQIVGMYSDGTVMKSNVIRCKIGASINAAERVTPEEASQFEQALAAYAEKLSQAIQAAKDSKLSAEESATAAAASAAGAGSAASAASESASHAAASQRSAAAASGYAEESLGAARLAAQSESDSRQHSLDALRYKNDAEASAGEAERTVGEAATHAEESKSYAEEASGYAADAAKSAEEVKSSDFVGTAIYKHNLSSSAHPEIRALIPSVKDFIKKETQDLVWYYRKAETYNRYEINELIKTIPSFKRQVVAALPETGDDTTIYLLRATDPQEKNYFIEYIYVNSSWEIIGGQSLNLDNYAEKDWVEDLLEANIPSLDGYATEDWVAAQIGELLTSDEIDSIFS